YVGGALHDIRATQLSTLLLQETFTTINDTNPSISHAVLSKDSLRRIQWLFGTPSRLSELLEASRHSAGADKDLDDDGARQGHLPVFTRTEIRIERPIEMGGLKSAQKKPLGQAQSAARRGLLTPARKLMVLAVANTGGPANALTRWAIS